MLAVVIESSVGHHLRVILSKSDFSGRASFYRTGNGCFAHKEQSRMIPPVPELMLHLTLKRDVLLDVPSVHDPRCS